MVCSQDLRLLPYFLTHHNYSVFTAICFVDNTLTSISKNVAACVGTNTDAVTDTAQYTSAVVVWSCAGESALAYTNFVHFPNSIATSINTRQW